MKNNRTKTIQEVRDRGAALGLNLLSKEYIGTRYDLEWVCDKGHYDIRPYMYIQQGRGCAECNNSVRRKRSYD